MATINAANPTLLDWAKRLDPNGTTANIVEMLEEVNEILLDMPFKQGNLPTGHRTTLRTELPTVYWRLMNMPVPTSKSRTAQVTEACAMLESWSEVDAALAQLNDDVAGFRLSEARAFLQAMAIEHASTLFYGVVGTAPEEFNGLAIRYSDLSAANANNILDAGGTGSDNTSVWLVGYGDQATYGIFAKGTTAGIQRKDFGLRVQDSTSGKMAVLTEQFTLNTGLVTENWQKNVRICNIDVSTLIADVSPANLTKFMIKAVHHIKDRPTVKLCFYMNQTCMQQLDIQRYEAVQTGGQLRYEVVDGVEILTFRGIPIRRCDALLNTESRVV